MATKQKDGKGKTGDGPTIEDLVALLAHFLPGLDPDEAVNDLATKRDGTIVYVGDYKLGNDLKDTDDDDGGAEDDDTGDADEGDDEGDDPPAKAAARKTVKPRAKRRMAGKVDKARTGDYDPVPTNNFGDNRTSL